MAFVQWLMLLAGGTVASAFHAPGHWRLALGLLTVTVDAVRAEIHY
jgi:hypothetical protein